MNIGRELISRVTDAVMDDARAWQQRPLDDVYPVVFLDAWYSRSARAGRCSAARCYLALGRRPGRQPGCAGHVVSGNGGL